MEHKVNRSVRVEEGKVFAVTKTENDNDGLIQIKTLENEMSLEYMDELVLDDDLQLSRYKKTETQNKEQISKIKTRLSEYSNKVEYIDYKKNFGKYECFEKLIELKFNIDLLNDEAKEEFNAYSIERDNFKEYYITYTEEQQLESLELNLIAFEDIWTEADLFRVQMKEVKELLNDRED